MRKFYLTLIDAAGELPAAIAAAQSWIRAGGFDPNRFAWECKPVAGGRFVLRADEL